MRVLKSPQIRVVSWGWRVSRSCSTWLVASVSSIFRFVSDVVGGMYVLTMFTRSLFGRIILVCKPYSFDDVDSIFKCFRTSVARPPLVLSFRRSSIML